MNERAHELRAIISYGHTYLHTIAGRDGRLLQINLSESSFCDTSSTGRDIFPTDRTRNARFVSLFLTYSGLSAFNLIRVVKRVSLKINNFINDVKFLMLHYRRKAQDRSANHYPHSVLFAPTTMISRTRLRYRIASRLNQRIIVDMRKSRRRLFWVFGSLSPIANVRR